MFGLEDSVLKYAKLILKANLWDDSIALLPAQKMTFRSIKFIKLVRT